MNRAEFGQLVVALRKENIDLLEGKIWTQKHLAARANLPERMIGQLEQGNKMNLEPTVIAQLAQALGLTSMERAAFHAAAAEVDVNSFVSLQKPPAIIFAELLAATNDVRLPTYIYDAYGTVVALNAAMRALSILPEAMWATGNESPAGFNLLRYYFASDSPIRTFLGINWTQFAVRTVQHFRATSLKYRHTTRFHTIFRDLYQYPAFQDFWARSKYVDEDVYHRWDGIAYHHPQLGPLNYIVTEAATLTGREELFLVIYVPRDRQTAETFEALAQRVGVNMHKAASWPYADELESS
ncbi:MAG: helix-turn-helix transcriptional regulator [Caldilineaceae bacterium]